MKTLSRKPAAAIQAAWIGWKWVGPSVAGMPHAGGCWVPSCRGDDLPKVLRDLEQDTVPGQPAQVLWYTSSPTTGGGRKRAPKGGRSHKKKERLAVEEADILRALAPGQWLAPREIARAIGLHDGAAGMIGALCRRSTRLECQIVGIPMGQTTNGLRRREYRLKG